MRTIPSQTIIDQVAKAVVDINVHMHPSIHDFFEEKLPTLTGKEKTVIEILLQNAQIAQEKKVPLCQDTGLMIVFAKVGIDVHLEKPLQELIDEGVRRGAKDGYLRCSIVSDPLQRTNTGDNTPAIVHTELVKGDRLELHIMAKGGGSENASAVKTLVPGDGQDGIIQFVVDQVKAKGANCCPPLVIGVGIGGDIEISALLAKKALLRKIGERHPDPYYKAMEEDLLGKINDLQIGAGGYSGRLTAMDVLIETAPCHIASLPVAVNLGCNSTRHTKIEL